MSSSKDFVLNKFYNSNKFIENLRDNLNDAEDTISELSYEIRRAISLAEYENSKLKQSLSELENTHKTCLNCKNYDQTNKEDLYSKGCNKGICFEGEEYEEKDSVIQLWKELRLE